MANFTTRNFAAAMMAGAASLTLVAGAGFAQMTGGAGSDDQMQTQSGTGSTTTGAGAAGQTAAMMEEDDVQSLLEDLGFSDVENLERTGIVWSAEAKRDDTDVELLVERMMQSGYDLDEDIVQSLLQTEGFSNVSDVEESDGVWSAEADRDGDSVTAHVDGERQVVVSEKDAG